MTTLDGKAEAARRIQNRQHAKESMGVCDWMFPLIDIPRGQDHVGDPSFESRILSAMLGQPISEQELYRVGERVFNLQRAVLLREGHRARQDDLLPDEWHRRQIQTHVADPELLAPGPRGEIVSQLGRRAEMSAYLRVRDEFYQRRGWDVPSGLQSAEGLRALELPEVAEDLLARGLAVRHARGIPLAARIRHRFNAWREGRRGAAGGLEERQQAEPVEEPELTQILLTEQGKFGAEQVRHNFRGWNKTMQYTFPDIGAHYAIRFVDGEAQPPEKLDAAVEKPEISYEMDTWVLREMSAGRLSGKQAYFKRLLRIKAAFGDMMKLQSLNRL
jgi:hypothetical protein